MPYYHVLAATATEPEKLRCIASDLSESDLKKSIVRPYKSGRSILLNGRIYPASELRAIQIVKTKADAELTLDAATYETNQELARMNDSSSNGVFVGPFSGYGLDDIAEYGEVVTKDYVQKAPGDAGVLRYLKLITEHPWITAAFTALLALITTPLSGKVSELVAALWER